MPVQGGLVNTRDGQKRFPRQFLPKCTFSVGIVAMAHLRLDRCAEGAGDVGNPAFESVASRRAERLHAGFSAFADLKAA
jgi:hypothetical protein